jgi:hypothetical protein
MGQNNTTVTTKKSLEDNQNLIVGNSVSNLRIGIAKTEKRLLDLNVILLNYRTNERIIRARIQNNELSIEEQLSGSQTHANPINSFSMSVTDPNPHKQIPVEQYNALHRSYGTPELISTLNSIDHDIKEAITLINKLEAELASFKAQLAEAEVKFKNPLKFLSGILPPTASDLEKDAIQKSLLSNIALLYQLSLSFKSLSMNSSGGRAYSDDPVMAPILMKMKSTFWAHAQQFPEYIEPNGLKTLIFNDPGDDWNIQILKTDHDTLRVAGVSDKADAAATEYVKAMATIKNSSNLSKNLSTKPETPLLPGESLNYKTRTFSATSTRMGVSYNGSFEMPDLLSSVKKWWKNKNKNLMVGLPDCPNVPKPIQTSTDTSPVRQAQAVADEAAKLQGQNAFNEAMARARSLQEKINKSSEIPNDSPQWVKQFSAIYGEAEIGSIKFQGTDYYVTRVVAYNQTAAEENTNKILDPVSQANPISQTYNNTAKYAYTPGNTAPVDPTMVGPLQQILIYYTLWKLKEEPTENLPPDLTDKQLQEVARLDKDILWLQQDIARLTAAATSSTGVLSTEKIAANKRSLAQAQQLLTDALNKKFSIVNGPS